MNNIEKRKELNIEFSACGCPDPNCKDLVLVRQLTVEDDAIILLFIQDAFSPSPKIMLRAPIEYSDLNEIMLRWLLGRTEVPR
jgi:hypothetical protein